MNTDDRPSNHAAPTSVRWGVFTLAFAMSALLYLHRYVFAFIKPTLAKEWGLSNTELGAIDSAFSLFYSLCQLPFAMAADALGVHLVLTVLMIVWLSGLRMMAWAPSAKWMWYALALLGARQSAVYACLNRIARTWFPPAIRTTLQGLVGIFAGRLGCIKLFSRLYVVFAGRMRTWLANRAVDSGCGRSDAVNSLHEPVSQFAAPSPSRQRCRGTID